MCYFNSSAIVAADYDPASRLLHIWFTSKDEPYTHYRVPEHIFRGLITAPSAGSYYNSHIRGRYTA
ncbi:MAG: KTSC domain-containing protein [Verrucomicrobiaceae bacterium]|nr:KTSC domain-containing protein [Verrucomicrobiaceae bacterium]